MNSYVQKYIDNSIIPVAIFLFFFGGGEFNFIDP